MAYDEGLADRVRKALRRRRGLTEKRMFGGLAFLQDRKMSCGILGDELMVRVGPDAHEAALRKAHVRPMDFTGRSMKGYVFVGARGLRSGASLASWLDQARRFVQQLQVKSKRR